MASGSQHNTMRAISHGMARSLSVSVPTSSAMLAVLRGRNAARQRLPDDYAALQQEGTNLIDDADALPDLICWTWRRSVRHSPHPSITRRWGRSEAGPFH